MQGAAQQVDREVAALWMEVFGSPPEAGADPARMLDEIIERAELPAYNRLTAAKNAHGLVLPR